MKLDKEFLLKNRFWVLLGTAVFFWLVSLVIVFFGPAKKASAESKNFAELQKKLTAPKNPKNASFLPPWREREELFRKAKNKVWEQAWKTQTNVMTWPGGLDTLRDTGHFGDTIAPDSLDRYKNAWYDTQFPTKRSPNLEAFLGIRSGEEIYFPIRYDPPVLGQRKWMETPDSEECWLAQEELWVRRDVFRVLTAALRSMGQFTEVRDGIWDRALMVAGGVAFDGAMRSKPEMQPKMYKERPVAAGFVGSRLLRNHNWEVELLLEAAKDGKPFISPKSTIKNINPYGRSLSLVNEDGNKLRLKIRQRGKQPITVELEGKMLTPGASATFAKPEGKESAIDLKGELTMEEIYDSASSPIRQLEKISLGAEALPHRLAVLLTTLDVNRMVPKPQQSPDQGGGGNFGGMGGQQGGMMPPGGMGGQQGGMMPPGGGQQGMMPPGGGGGGQFGQGGGGNAPPPVKEDTGPNKLHRKRYVLCNDQVRRMPVAFVVVVDQTQRSEVLAALASSQLHIQTTQWYWRHRDLPPATGKDQPMGGTVVSGVDKTKVDASGPSESTRNLVELTVYGIASLYERYPPRPPQAPAEGGPPGPPSP
jgi:hypothetical protein